jgi:hypothetical protein
MTKDKIKLGSLMLFTLYLVSLVLYGMGYVLNVICLLEMRDLSKMLIVNLQRKKSSCEKPGRSKDEHTTLGFSRSRMLWWD